MSPATGHEITDAYAKMRLEILMPILGHASMSHADFTALERAFSALARHNEDAGHQAIIGRRHGGAPRFEDDADRDNPSRR